MNKLIIVVAKLICILSCLLNPQAKADTSWRIAPDLIIKSQWLSDLEPSPGYWLSAGVDAYKTFTFNGRSFVNASVQLYAWCVKDRIRKPGILKGTDDCKVVSKVSKLNFLVSGDGKFNIMVGHTELPFGLEVPVSTNETIRSLLTPRDTGLKLDWGTGVNGTIDGLAYDFTVTRGSGFEWEDRAVDGRKPLVFSGRLGTATDNQSFLPSSGKGFSVFKGDVLSPNDTISERWRVAYDQIDYIDSIGYMFQFSLGETDGRDVTNAFFELNTNSVDERFVAYTQLKSFNERFESGWQRSQTLALGFRYHLSGNFILSAQVSREPNQFFNTPQQTLFDLQLRMRLE